MKAIQPPSSLDVLLARAEQLAGLTLAELAERFDVRVPQDLKRNKGWIGQLVECALGAHAGSKAEPDFPELQVELKTLPIQANGMPLETTFVTTLPLIYKGYLDFEDSVLFHKLRQVLWVPVQGDRCLPLAERRLGMPFLWRPSAAQWALLRQDWEELMELVCTGQVEQLSSVQGQVLQVRPKAAHGRVLTQAIGAEGQKIFTRPRGFYLKKKFTTSLLSAEFY